jgi:phosphoglycerate dehydrogenase-like enzyme
MPRLLVLSKQSDEYQRLIEAGGLPDLECVSCSDPAAALLPGRDCDIVFGDAGLIRHVIGALPGVRWVQTTSAGVEPLLDPQLRRDYMLTNVYDVFGPSMTEYVFAYLLLHERRIFERRRSQTEHRWKHDDSGGLRGRTIGLLGVGSIGAEIARTAKHFGMNVRGYTRSSESSRSVDAYFHGPHLLDFARGLDYLVSVLPNTPGTRRIVDAGLLGALPAHAVLVNIGRGAAVDEAALIRALKAERLALAVLDVFEQEPLPREHPFWDTPNLLMTFHTSAWHAPADMVRPFFDNYKRFVRGEELQHRVDFERGY